MNSRSFAAHLCLCFCFAAISLTASAQSTLLPITTAQGVVFDYSGQYLYIATYDGFIDRYNLATGVLDTPYNLGGGLNGIDIARDNSFLLVAQATVTGSQGTFQKVNLSNGLVTNINYDRAFGEYWSWDVAIASNGLALVTTRGGYLRQINLTTNAVSIRTDAPSHSGDGGYVGLEAQIFRGSGGTRLYILESSNSTGPLFVYDATTDTFGLQAQTDRLPDASSAAVNRDGSLLGSRFQYQLATIDTAATFTYVRSFHLDAGIAFDGAQDVFYGVNSETDQIVAYTTDTFTEKFRLTIGEDVSAQTLEFNGRLTASPDGRYLALRTPSGIRLFAIPSPSSAEKTGSALRQRTPILSTSK